MSPQEISDELAPRLKEALKHIHQDSELYKTYLHLLEDPDTFPIRKLADLSFYSNKPLSFSFRKIKLKLDKF